MQTFLETMIAGLVGTSFMSVTMAGIHSLGWANADMIRGLGSLLTGSLEKALVPGLLVHLVSGVLVFAIPYAAILGAFGTSAPLITILIGAVMGLMHGLGMSLVLLSVVSRRHPLPEFREAGFEVAAAHIAGHVAYGVGVAVVVLAFGIDWGLRV